jgi:xanthosine utilization system XapX-like protein
MRLERVEKGHALKERAILGLIGLMSGERAMDVLRTLMYRPQFFGKAFSGAVQEALRGESEWSVGERELIASFVASRNQCLF